LAKAERSLSTVGPSISWCLRSGIWLGCSLWFWDLSDSDGEFELEKYLGLRFNNLINLGFFSSLSKLESLDFVKIEPF
jgi:hypothetical protein